MNDKDCALYVHIFIQAKKLHGKAFHLIINVSATVPTEMIKQVYKTVLKYYYELVF